MTNYHVFDSGSVQTEREKESEGGSGHERKKAKEKREREKKSVWNGKEMVLERGVLFSNMASGDGVAHLNSKLVFLIKGFNRNGVGLPEERTRERERERIMGDRRWGR